MDISIDSRLRKMFWIRAVGIEDQIFWIGDVGERGNSNINNKACYYRGFAKSKIPN